MFQPATTEADLPDNFRGIARRLYNGKKRNPWNEIECGNNYVRSMSSFALLLTFARFQFDTARNMIGFNSITQVDSGFHCFWSLDSGWGEFEIKPAYTEVRVLNGHLTF